MTSEWEIVSLGDYCEIKNGYAFKSKDFSTSGVPVIKIKNVKPNQIVESDFSYIPEDIALEKDKWIIRKGDILLTMTGNRADGSPESWVGKAAIFTLDGKYLLNQRVASIRSKSIELDTEYLGYFLSSWESQLYFIKHSNSSGGQANISPDIVRQYLIPLPPLAVQKRMVSVLKVIDEMISANQQINDNLYAQAKAIFAQRFIGIETIPDGWKKGNLLDIANYLNGLAMQKFRPRDDEVGLPVLKIKELRQGSCDVSSELCSPSIKPEYIVHDGDVIFSWSGSLLVDIWCGGTCGLNQHLFKVTSETYDQWFYYLWTAHHLERFIAIAADKATTMGHIKRGELEKAEVLIPSEKDYKEISSLMNPLFNLIIANRIEARKLAELRDELLPKLMSGEIDVSEVSV